MLKTKISIVDYSQGNCGSIANMLRYCGYSPLVTSDPDEISNSSHIILPGVGSFDRAINNLKKFNLLSTIERSALVDTIPFLGICLGAQLMTNKSEEGNSPGFGWINADTIKFRFSGATALPVPNIGWREVNTINPFGFMQNTKNSKYYHVHSYYMNCHDLENVMMTSNYGITFHTGLRKDNLYAVQFHPEKSHKYGIKFFQDFIASTQR